MSDIEIILVSEPSLNTPSFQNQIENIILGQLYLDFHLYYISDSYIMG